MDWAMAGTAAERARRLAKVVAIRFMHVSLGFWVGVSWYGRRSLLASVRDPAQ
jgi:hypothetical protein